MVQASFFTFLTSLFDKEVTPSEIAAPSLNSQRMALLEPAVNLNPNPPKGGGNINVADGIALVPETSPAGTTLEAEDQPQSSQISIYTVREGDTLSEIAEMFDVSINTIAWANDIKGRVIHPGQVLILLPVTGVSYTVAKGDTLASIAKKYEGDAEEIANYNELATDAELTVGGQIIIPDGVIAAPKVSIPVRSASGVAATTPASSAGMVNPLPGSVKTQGIHGYNGVDLGGTPAGSPVLAAAAGSVIVAKGPGWNGGYGSYVVIQHNNGTQTLYAHLSSVSVSVGQSVGAGAQVGGVGSTGRSTGIHLHFEVRGASNPFK